MKSLKFSGKPRKPSVLIRRVVGDSMTPTLRAGQIVIVSGRFAHLRPRDIVVIRHAGLEKIKRISQIDPLRGVFVVGDNLQASTDSRSFGWLDFDEIVGRVIWPRNT
jgi:phage repressor protein C with HTH and peptisase S24 domain